MVFHEKNVNAALSTNQRNLVHHPLPEISWEVWGAFRGVVELKQLGDFPTLSHLSGFSVMSVSSLFSLPREFEMISSWSLGPHWPVEANSILKKQAPAVATNNQSRTLRLFTCNLPSKTCRPSSLKDSGTVILSKEQQSGKANSPMAVSDTGRVTLAKDLQP